MRTISFSTILCATAGILAVGLGAGCNSPVKPDPPPLATFTVSGVVRSSADQSPVDNATVKAVGVGSTGMTVSMTSTTDVEGRYTISGLRDQVGISATRVGFFTAASTIQLTQDVVLDLTMQKAAPTILEGGDLVLGEAVSGSIGPKDDLCDPNWDRFSPCRRFALTAPVRRSYHFTVRIQACDELELHVIQNGSRWMYADFKNSLDQGVILDPGIYEVRLMAYYECGLFELTVR
jgi:hypothetical protein